MNPGFYRVTKVVRDPDYVDIKNCVPDHFCHPVEEF